MPGGQRLRIGHVEYRPQPSARELDQQRIDGTPDASAKVPVSQIQSEITAARDAELYQTWHPDADLGLDVNRVTEAEDSTVHDVMAHRSEVFALRSLWPRSR